MAEKDAIEVEVRVFQIASEQPLSGGLPNDRTVASHISEKMHLDFIRILPECKVLLKIPPCFLQTAKLLPPKVVKQP